MTEKKPEDPGFWRRPMTRRGQVIVFTVAGVLVVGAIVYALVAGIRLF